MRASICVSCPACGFTDAPSDVIVRSTSAMARPSNAQALGGRDGVT